ncbi:MAG: PAS domain-containing sensor histidine kinase [Oligoflexia bacterium]|nr:PAS domain-containing sensor histidine kinase [Oligoflexia bacterium]
MATAERLAHYGSWEWDLDKNELRASDNWYRIHGLNPQPITMEKLMPLAHPDDRAAIELAFDEALREQRSYDIQHRIIKQDTGEVRWLQAYGELSEDKDGTHRKLIGASQDITRYKQVEEALHAAAAFSQSLIDSMLDGFSVLDAQGVQADVNPSLCQMTGFSKEELIGTKPPFPYWPPEEYERIQAALDKALKRDFGDFELIFMRKSGERFPVIVSPSVVNDKNGNPTGYLATVKDITERKALENDLRAAVEIRDEFMSVASHELRTPLTALHLQLQLLARLSSVTGAVTDRNIGDLSKGALASAQSLVHLLDDLLDVTRIRVGRLKLKAEKMDLRSAVANAIALVQEFAKQRGSVITLNADQPLVGSWDPVRISQILSNLLSNAIKYGDGKPIEVTLIEDPSAGVARILVRDQGIGISPEMQSKIFERFHRAVSGDKITGLGLGLYIARQIIEAHRGNIRVESGPNEGSLFSVELPLHPAPEEAS